MTYDNYGTIACLLVTVCNQYHLLFNLINAVSYWLAALKCCQIPETTAKRLEVNLLLFCFVRSNIIPIFIYFLRSRKRVSGDPDGNYIIYKRLSNNQYTVQAVWKTVLINFLFFPSFFLFMKPPRPSFKLNKNIFKYEKLGSNNKNILINFYKHFTRGRNQHDIIKTNFLKKEKLIIYQSNNSFSVYQLLGTVNMLTHNNKM